jgi:hypothetical protein
MFVTNSRSCDDAGGSELSTLCLVCQPRSDVHKILRFPEMNRSYQNSAGTDSEYEGLKGYNLLNIFALYTRDYKSIYALFAIHVWQFVQSADALADIVIAAGFF